MEKINKDLKKERELLVEKSDDLESQVQANAAVLQNMEAMTEEKKELLTKLSLLEKANNDMNAQIASLEQELNEGKNQADTQEARTALSLKNLAQLQEEISKALDVLSPHE